MAETKTLFCKCGCNDGVILKYEHEDSMAYLSLVSDIFFINQKSGRDRFKEKLKRIGNVMRNREYCYFEIVIKPDEFEDFKVFVAKMGIDEK